MPDFIKQMTEKRLLGQKTKQGFYKRVEENGKKVTLSIDYKTLQYKPQQKVKFASLEAAKSMPGTAGKMKSPLLRGRCRPVSSASEPCPTCSFTPPGASRK